MRFLVLLEFLEGLSQILTHIHILKCQVVFLFHVLSVSSCSFYSVQLMHYVAIHALVLGLICKWAELCLQFTVSSHFGLNLLIKIHSALVKADCRRSSSLRHGAALVGVTYTDGLLEGTLASWVLLLLRHEAGVGGICKILYIS